MSLVSKTGYQLWLLLFDFCMDQVLSEPLHRDERMRPSEGGTRRIPSLPWLQRWSAVHRGTGIRFSETPWSEVKDHLLYIEPQSTEHSVGLIFSRGTSLLLQRVILMLLRWNEKSIHWLKYHQITATKPCALTQWTIFGKCSRFEKQWRSDIWSQSSAAWLLPTALILQGTYKNEAISISHERNGHRSLNYELWATTPDNLHRTPICLVSKPL